MRTFLSIGASALTALCAAACSTPAHQTGEAQVAVAGLSYPQALAVLIGATQTRDDFQSTSMSEGREPCTLFFEVAPGRQSTMGFQFDLRQLDLDAVSAADGQVAQSRFSRRIACASKYGMCASNTGRPVPFVDIAAPTAEDMDRALEALRQLQTACQKPDPAS